MGECLSSSQLVLLHAQNEVKGFFIYRSKRWSVELLLKISSGAQYLQVLLIQESSLLPQASWAVTFVRVK